MISTVKKVHIIFESPAKIILNFWKKISNYPPVAKAQQDPQLPWSLTALTAPIVLQSTDSGKSYFFLQEKKKLYKIAR